MVAIRQSFALLFLAAVSVATAQSPEIARISPLSARPGESVSVTLHGKDLQQPQKIWTSFGATVVWESSVAAPNEKATKTDDRVVKGKLTLPANAPFGVGYLRLPTLTGLSGPLFFLVDDLSVELKRANESLAKAQLLKVPVAVEGAADSARSDFYKFEMKAGESVSVEVFAHRLGSKMDPLIRLLDVNGSEIASVDDVQGLAGDCRLRHRAVSDGPVIIEVRDASFAGGAEHFYHLRIGDFPLVTAITPPVAAPGVLVQVAPLGEAVEGVAPVAVNAAKAGCVDTPVAFRFSPEKPPAFATLRVEDAPSHTLDKGGASAEQPAAAPCTVFGKLEKAGEQSSFWIEGKAGERLTLTPLTRGIGSPAVLYLGAEDSRGAFLVANDTAAAGDAPLTVTVPKEGKFQVLVEDIARRGGAAFVFGVQVRRINPGFELTAPSDRFVVATGGSFGAKITAQRNGVTGPITLELQSADARPLPAGIRCEQNIIEKGKNETQLKVLVSKDVPQGAIHHLRIVGRAVEGEVIFSTSASVAKKENTKEAVFSTLPSMPNPPRLLGESLLLYVLGKTPEFFGIELTDSPVVLPTVLGKGQFVVRQKSIDPSFTGNCQLGFEGLPKGVTIKAEAGRGGRIKGQVDFICEVTGTADIFPSEHTFDIVATAEHKGVQKEVRLAQMPLRITLPLGITGSLEAPVAPGKKQTLRIIPIRYDTINPQPIEVALQHLPAGVTGPAKVTIAPGDTLVTVELQAAETAAEGESDTLVLRAVSRVNGMAVTVESLPIRVEVRK